jgi:hypothetical protein
MVQSNITFGGITPLYETKAKPLGGRGFAAWQARATLPALGAAKQHFCGGQWRCA